METEGSLGTKMLFSDKIQIAENWISFSWVQQLRITRLALIGCLLTIIHKNIFSTLNSGLRRTRITWTRNRTGTRTSEDYKFIWFFDDRRRKFWKNYGTSEDVVVLRRPDWIAPTDSSIEKSVVFVTVIKIGCLTRYSEMGRFFGYQYMTVIVVVSAETRAQPSIQPLHSN